MLDQMDSLVHAGHRVAFMFAERCNIYCISRSHVLLRLRHYSSLKKYTDHRFKVRVLKNRTSSTWKLQIIGCSCSSCVSAIPLHIKIFSRLYSAFENYLCKKA